MYFLSIYTIHVPYMNLKLDRITWHKYLLEVEAT